MISTSCKLMSVKCRCPLQFILQTIFYFRRDSYTCDKWMSKLTSSGWLTHVKDILTCGCLVAQCVERVGFIFKISTIYYIQYIKKRFFDKFYTIRDSVWHNWHCPRLLYWAIFSRWWRRNPAAHRKSWQYWIGVHSCPVKRWWCH